jgi:hypothetical protein
LTLEQLLTAPGDILPIAGNGDGRPPELGPVTDALRLEVQIGAETRAATIVTHDGPKKTPLPVLPDAGDHADQGGPTPIPRQAYHSIADLMPFLQDEDEAIHPLTFEQLMSRTLIYPASPTSPPPRRAEISRPIKGIDGRTYAVIGARHWTKQPTPNGPDRAHFAITYVFRECVQPMFWPADRKRFERFELLPMFESVAPENVPLDGLECDDEDGDTWILKGQEDQFWVDVIGDPIPTPEERRRMEDSARTGKAQDDADTLDTAARLELPIPEKPEGQKTTWYQWRHNVMNAASRASLDVGDVRPQGLALDLYLGCVKPGEAVSLIQELDLLTRWKPFPPTFDVGDVAGKGAIICTNYQQGPPYRVIDCRRQGKTWSLTCVDYDVPEPKPGGKYKQSLLRWLNDIEVSAEGGALVAERPRPHHRPGAVGGLGRRDRQHDRQEGPLQAPPQGAGQEGGQEERKEVMAEEIPLTLPSGADRDTTLLQLGYCAGHVMRLHAGDIQHILDTTPALTETNRAIIKCTLNYRKAIDDLFGVPPKKPKKD